MELEHCHEVVGKLEKYTEKNGKMHLVFQIKKIVDIPLGAIPKSELDDCLYRKIGIINIDGDYRIRKSKEPRAIDAFKEKYCPTCNEKELCKKDVTHIFYCILGKIQKLRKGKDIKK